MTTAAAARYLAFPFAIIATTAFCPPTRAVSLQSSLDSPARGALPGALTGVIDYGLATNSNTGAGDYKLHPTVAPVFATANARMSAPAAVGGNVKVASFNVLNYFTTFTDGSAAGGQTGQGCSLGNDVRASNCRGASNLAEFGRQRAKIVEALAALDADIVGLMEIQNNGSLAVQNQVDALNSRLVAGTYATIALPAQGTGTDAIRVAMVYKPARVGLLGVPRSDVAAINNRLPVSPAGQWRALLGDRQPPQEQGQLPAAWRRRLRRQPRQR